MLLAGVRGGNARALRVLGRQHATRCASLDKPTNLSGPLSLLLLPLPRPWGLSPVGRDPTIMEDGLG